MLQNKLKLVLKPHHVGVEQVGCWLAIFIARFLLSETQHIQQSNFRFKALQAVSVVFRITRRVLYRRTVLIIITYSTHLNHVKSKR